MYRWDPDHYLKTPQAQLTQHYRRRSKRLRIEISGIEPRSKAQMPESDKDEVQRQILRWMIDRHRQRFRGPVAMQLSFTTTERNPAHIHNIAKNLLDLFSKPRAALMSRRSGLLYADDQQIHALAVDCSHGMSEPKIQLLVRPLGDLLQDLRLAEIFRDWQDPSASRHDFDDAIDELADVLRIEPWLRQFGDKVFEEHELLARMNAQQAWLGGQASLTPHDLHSLYGVDGGAVGDSASETWEQLFRSSPLRVFLSELPQAKGASSRWKKHIDEKLIEFQRRNAWLIKPLVVPVALEVLVRPPPPTRQRGMHDLDNIVRSYLLPRVLEILQPLSDISFTFKAGTTPPKSTKTGVSRYGAWRIRPAPEGSEGFVSLALVSQFHRQPDVLEQVDDQIRLWAETIW